MILWLQCDFLSKKDHILWKPFLFIDFLIQAFVHQIIVLWWWRFDLIDSHLDVVWLSPCGCGVINTSVMCHNLRVIASRTAPVHSRFCGLQFFPFHSPHHKMQFCLKLNSSARDLGIFCQFLFKLFLRTLNFCSSRHTAKNKKCLTNNGLNFSAVLLKSIYFCFTPYTTGMTRLIRFLFSKFLRIFVWLAEISSKICL